MKRRASVLLLAAAVLAGMILLTACAQPTPQIVEKIVKETVVVEKEKVVEKPVEKIVKETVIVEKPVEKVITATVAAKPLPPAVGLEILAIPMNASLPDAITNTLKYITDTAVPAGGVARIATGATGLDNVPLNVPVRLAATIDEKNPPKRYTWTLSAPAGSKATLVYTNTQKTQFTPDVVGVYLVTVVGTNDAGNSPAAGVQLHAGTYIGYTAGNCKQCHAEGAAWEKTAHATSLTEQIDGWLDPPNNRFAESCIYCKTTGYHLNADNGGFDDIQAKTGWKFPTFAQVAKGGNWNAMPAELKNMANIQCEACHGPAKEHATLGAKTMDSSLAKGACDICHNSSSRHMKGTDLTNAKHLMGETFETVNGPGRQACMRCHGGEGFITFTKNPTSPSAWSNEESPITCAVCHDPHDDKNAWQLRIVGKPVGMPFESKDVGLSAICYTCHHARTKPQDAIRGTFPHYSSVAEFLSDTGGVTYGQNVPNSPHGAMVGIAPIKNPDAKAKTDAAFLFSSPGKDGYVPGSCVVCHMWATITDEKDPYYHKVGAHTFNTVSPDGKFDYGAPCKSCHGDIKDFNLKAKADYDGNGKVEGVQDEVKGLLNVLLKALESKGVKTTPSFPYATLPRGADGQTDDKIENAWYNYRTVYGVMWHADEKGNIVPGNEGKSQAMHNFKRSVALLQLSYKDLMGQDVPGATLMK